MIFDSEDNNIKKLSIIEKIRRIIKGDLTVDCTCKSFRYGGYAYIMTQKDAKYGKAVNIAPKRKNPSLNGSVCKHLRRVFDNIEFMVSEIVKHINIDGTPKP